MFLTVPSSLSPRLHPLAILFYIISKRFKNGNLQKRCSKERFLFYFIRRFISTCEHIKSEDFFFFMRVTSSLNGSTKAKRQTDGKKQSLISETMAKQHSKNLHALRIILLERKWLLFSLKTTENATFY